jgi:hypothetical protein
MRLFSTVLDALLPNRAWNRRVKNLADSRTRLVYLSVRISLAIVVFLLVWLLGIQQHQQLR